MKRDYRHVMHFPSHSPLPREGRDIKYVITTADLNCIYLQNNFKTFSGDLLSPAPLTRTLFHRAPFSHPVSTLFSNLAFETAITLQCNEDDEIREKKREGRKEAVCVAATMRHNDAL